jgi:hypothetical protein
MKNVLLQLPKSIGKRTAKWGSLEKTRFCHDFDKISRKNGFWYPGFQKAIKSIGFCFTARCAQKHEKHVFSRKNEKIRFWNLPNPLENVMPNEGHLKKLFFVMIFMKFHEKMVFGTQAFKKWWNLLVFALRRDVRKNMKKQEISPKTWKNIKFHLGAVKAPKMDQIYWFLLYGAKMAKIAKRAFLWKNQKTFILDKKWQNHVFGPKSCFCNFLMVFKNRQNLLENVRPQASNFMKTHEITHFWFFHLVEFNSARTVGI